jgi:RNA polymerase sigma-70 factor (ECF subfamily)
MTEATEAALLGRWRAGDGDAFAELVQRHQSALLRFARGLLGVGSAYEDVVQEAFLRLAEKPPELPEEALGSPDLERAQLSGWLHTVTRNLCMDVLRSEARRKTREQEVAAREAADGGVDAVEERDTRELVARRLSLLPIDQRDVLVLRLLADKSYREIAQITGKKIGTVGWLISVGLAALGRELAPLLEGRSTQADTETRHGGLVEPGSDLGMVQGELS